MERSPTNTFVNYSWMPTKIEAVARVNSDGTIKDIVLLKTPDNPVFDRFSNAYTPILPCPRTSEVKEFRLLCLTL